MGRYRELVALLVQHSNITSRALTRPRDLGNGISLNSVSWQVLEYLIEHEDDLFCMNQLSEALGIPQSSFSKTARLLTEQGLIARYRTSGNRKNVILKPTEKGRQVYDSYSKILLEASFRPFFEKLDALDDKALHDFAEALAQFNRSLLGPDRPEGPDALIQLE